MRGPEVFPRPNVVAPLNTHVWVFDAPETGEVSLQAAGQEVPSTVSGYTMPDDRGEGFRQDLIQRVRELKPKQELKPRARYDVVWTAYKQAPKTLGSITTGDVADHEPPTWSGPVQVVIEESSHGPAACKIGMPHAMVWLGSVRDNQTHEEQLLISAAARIPGRTYPALVSVHEVRRGGRGALSVLHGGTLCDPRDFDFPPPLQQSELVLRAIDLAGNASAEHKQPLLGPLSDFDRELLRRVGFERDASGALKPPKAPEPAADFGLYIGLGVGALALVVVLVLLREQ